MANYTAGTASVEISPDFRRFVQKLRRNLDRVDAQLDVGVRPDEASLAEFRRTVQSRLSGMDLSVDVRVGADTSGAAAQVEAFRRAAQVAPLTVNVDADTSAAAARIAALRTMSAGAGGGGGGGFGAGFLNAGAIGISQLPAAAAAVGTIGTDLKALTQNAALLPGIFAGAAAGIATLTVGMQGMADAFDEDPKKAAAAMEDMAASARETVTAIRDYSDEWTRVRQTVQQNLFAGMAEPIRQVIDTQLPILEAGMGGVATRFGEGMRTALGEVGSDESAGALSTIFGNTASAANALNGSITPIISSVRTLATTGSSFLPEFGQGITNLATRFDSFISKADEAGDLARWMREGVDAAKTLGSVVGNAGSSISSVLRAAKGDGDGFLVTVDKLTERWSSWLSSDVGQSQMREFFVQGREQLDQWRPVLESVGTVLKSLYDASQAWSSILLPFLQAAAGLLEGQEGTVTTLLTAWLAYKTLSPILGAVQSGIAGVTTRVDAFRTATSNASANGAGALRGSVAGLAGALGTGGVLGIALLGATAGLGFLAQKHQEAKQAADEQKRSLEALSQTLDDQSGKVTEETLAQIAGTLQKEGFLTRAEGFGINTQALVRASAGLDPGAKGAINDQITSIILEQRGSARSWGRAAEVTGLSDERIAQALQGVPEAVKEYEDAIGAAQLRQESGFLPSLADLMDQMNDVGESAATLGGKMNDTDSDVAQAGDGIRQYNEALKGTHELTEQGRKDFEGLQIAIQDVQALDGNTVVIETPTDKQKQDVLQLGDIVRELPDGSIIVDLKDEVAKAAIREIVKPETKTVTVNTEYVKATASGEWRAPMVLPKAQGGSITGGIPGVDSVPILAMPGEHVLTTSDVSKLGGQGGVYRFRAALQAGRVRGYATGGAVGWSDADEINLQQALAKVAQAQEKAQKVLDDPKASEADKRLAQLAVDEARDDAQRLEAKKSGPSTEVLPQAPLPERKSDRDIQIDNAQMAVDQANTKRNQVYADPNSTEADKRKADNDYLSAQNSFAKARKPDGEDQLPEQYSLPGILGAAGTIIGEGILSALGLENSVLSGNNPYNRALNTTLDFYQNKDKGAETDTGGYDYTPQNLPVEKEDSGANSSDSTTSSSDTTAHTYDAGAGVEQWRPTFAGVLASLGMPASWIGLGLAQMESESGGNPRAINNWDSNAAKGIPSKGLMQVIDPTFQSYRSGLYPNDIWDPSANIAAALRYLVARYGGPEGVWGIGQGYADGGWVEGIGGPRSDSIRARLSRGEFVVNAASAAANGDWLEAINAGLSLGVPTLPPGVGAPAAQSSSTTRDHSVQFHGPVQVMDMGQLVKEQDRWATNQAMGAMAAYT